MKKALWFLGVIVLVVILVIVFYKKSPSVAPSGEPLRVSFNTWIGSGIYFVAKEKGFWEKEGVNVVLEQTDEATVAKQLIASGKVDAITSWTPETIQVLADAGVPIKIVSVNDTSDGADGIIATQEIQSIEDLRGKKVAYEVGSPSHFLLSYLLDQKGMTTKDLVTVNQSAADAGASFVAGKVDAAVTWEPWLSKAKDRNGGHLLASTKGLPILSGGPIFLSDVVEKRPEDVKAFIRGVLAAVEYVNQHPDESYEIIAKGFSLTKQDVLDQVPTFGFFDKKQNLEQLQAGNGSYYDAINKAGELWVNLGLIKKSTPASSLVDISLLKTLNK